MTPLCTGQGDVSLGVQILHAFFTLIPKSFLNPSQILPEFSGSFPNPSQILLPESFFTNPSRILLLPQTPENFTTLPSNHGDLRICEEICEDLRSDLNKMALVPVWRYYRDLESLYISYCEWIPNHGNIDNYGPNTGCYLTQPLD